MKSRILKHSFTSSLFLVYMVLALATKVSAQQKQQADENEFTIVIEKTNDGLKLVSPSGSAWKELSFALNNYQPQAIDEWGMTQIGKVSAEKRPDLANYLFTIMKTDKGISLKGLDGTSWTELSFSLTGEGKQMINQDGMMQ